MAVLGLAPDSTSEPGSGTSASNRRASGVSSRNAVFAAGKASLLAALLAKNSASVWDAATGKGLSSFHVISLDRTHAFPPRKLPIVSLAKTASNQHSELSPLNASSPLYPDGIISPLWLKKHREQIPSAVVAFYPLWDRSALNDDSGALPLSAQSVTNMERERDQVLCQEINERR
ncbi:hypothetical protein HK405_013675 [Cladochytrium tenue]|nr:hypothetical protein HK405_013675 [Cladochytrium tenue]